MNLPEAIMSEVINVSDEEKLEILNFAKALREKENQELDAKIDAIIDEHLEAFKKLAE